MGAIAIHGSLTKFRYWDGLRRTYGKPAWIRPKGDKFSKGYVRRASIINPLSNHFGTHQVTCDYSLGYRIREGSPVRMDPKDRYLPDDKREFKSPRHKGFWPQKSGWWLKRGEEPRLDYRDAAGTNKIRDFTCPWNKRGWRRLAAHQQKELNLTLFERRIMMSLNYNQKLFL